MAARRAKRGRLHSIGIVIAVAIAGPVVACGSGDGDPAATPVGTTADTTPPASDPPATEPATTDPPTTDPPATEPPATEPPATEPPATEPPATPPPTTAPPDPHEFDDEMLADAIAEGAANPLVGLPGRDSLATERLIGDLTDGGFDLTGTALTVYPGASAPSFLLFETDDSSALVADDDGDGEAFVLAVLDSQAVADAGVEQLVLRHSSSDDEGPFVVTFIVPVTDLRAAVETGADAFERVAVQVERPG